jgi:hypothetical protein
METTEQKKETVNLYSILELSIRRKNTPTGLPGDDPTTQNPKIGSALRDRAPLSGLSFEEEMEYLPEIIGTDSKDVNFRKEVKEYWSNISEKVPHDIEATDLNMPGRKLKFTVLFKTEEDKKAFESAVGFEAKAEITKRGKIVEGIADYILFRYCLVYRRVANDEKEQHKSAFIDFYLFSREQKAKQEYSLFTLKNRARELFSTLLDPSNENRIDAILRLFDENPDNKDLYPRLEDKHIKLDSLIAIDPSKFIEYANDKKLAMKAFILKATEVGAIFKPSNTDLHYLGSDKEELLGRSLMETVLFLEDKTEKNAQILETLKAQVKFKTNS